MTYLQGDIVAGLDLLPGCQADGVPLYDLLDEGLGRLDGGLGGGEGGGGDGVFELRVEGGRGLLASQCGCGIAIGPQGDRGGSRGSSRELW